MKRNILTILLILITFLIVPSVNAASEKESVSNSFLDANITTTVSVNIEDDNDSVTTTSDDGTFKNMLPYFTTISFSLLILLLVLAKVTKHE